MLLKLLGLPVTLPASGIGYVLRTISDVAEREMYSEEATREELLRLQLALEEGEVAEDAFTAQEAVLLARLRQIRERRRARETEPELVEETEEGGRRVVVEIPEELR